MSIGFRRFIVSLNTFFKVVFAIIINVCYNKSDYIFKVGDYNMKIQQSREDYLETILVLQQRLGKVRSIDIANEFNYSKASVSRAMKLLREKGYITMDENNYIQFTDEGYKRANEIYERHRTITRFLRTFLE